MLKKRGVVGAGPEGVDPVVANRGEVLCIAPRETPGMPSFENAYAGLGVRHVTCDLVDKPLERV